MGVPVLWGGLVTVGCRSLWGVACHCGGPVTAVAWPITEGPGRAWQAWAGQCP